jgi:hypothetical protein
MSGVSSTCSVNIPAQVAQITFSGKGPSLSPSMRTIFLQTQFLQAQETLKTSTDMFTSVFFLTHYTPFQRWA